MKQTCTLPDRKGIMRTFYEQNVEINGKKNTRNADGLALFAARTQRDVVNHIAGSSNLLRNVFFISICVGGFLK